MPYGYKVKKIMQENGQTQKELSKATNISESNISKIIKENRNIREKTLYRLCRGLKCKPEDIMLED